LINFIELIILTTTTTGYFVGREIYKDQVEHNSIKMNTYKKNLIVQLLQL